MRRSSWASATGSDRSAISTKRWMRSRSGSAGGASTGCSIATSNPFSTRSAKSWLMRFIEHRIGDRRIIRLIAKWLTAGVLEQGRLIVTEEGTPQGAVISPLLANIYLHYVYDLWVHQWRQRYARGDVMRMTPSSASSIGTRRSSSLPI